MSRRRPANPSRTDTRRQSNRDERNRPYFQRILHRQPLRNSSIAADCVAELAVISEHYHSEMELASRPT